uniref:Uncharacterized protein n=1 Tax=Leptobrachium leishanense TaxID=445787 RepID=A0A8C5PGB6_9ANUR
MTTKDPFQRVWRRMWGKKKTEIICFPPPFGTYVTTPIVHTPYQKEPQPRPSLSGHCCFFIVHHYCSMILYKATVYICVTDEYWGHNCDYWGAVGWDTGHMGFGTSDAVVNRWGYKPDSAARRRSSEGQSLLNRMTLIGRGGWRCSIRSGAQTVQLTLTIQHPSQADTGVYVMGMYATATTKFPRYKFKLQDMAIYKKEENPFLPRKYGEVVRRPPLLPNTKSIANPTYEDSIVMETGFSDVNVWLEWVKFSALNNNRTNCYVCGAARPHLGTVPFNIPQDVEECFLSLYTNTTDSQSLCEYWKNSYPILTRLPQPGEGIHVYPGNYTCYRSAEKGRNLTFFPEGYCANYSNINSTKLQNQVFLIGDLYWICGDLKIRARLPLQWSGECALAKAIMGFHIVSDPEEIPNISSRRRKREVPSPQGSLDPHVYIDVIGVPRGVPDEFKARDQVKAGFESFLAPLVTINKNLDWINYLYYNQQRFVNYTREALQGLAPQPILTYSR